MHTGDAKHVAGGETVRLETELLALKLALEVARAGQSRRSFTLHTAATLELCDLLADDVAQLGGGAGLQRAVEELERVLREARELAGHRSGPGAGTSSRTIDPS